MAKKKERKSVKAMTTQKLRDELKNASGTRRNQIVSELARRM